MPDFTGFADFLENAIGKVIDQQQQSVQPEGKQPEVHFKHAREGETVCHEEAILLACAHPNVIECYGASSDGTELRIEKGEHDLYSHIENADNCQLDPEEVYQIADGLASGLEMVHSQGYAHCDLKMENVVMCKGSDGESLTPKLIDFEFAHHVDEAPPEGEDKVAGTRAYFSPEKWIGTSNYDRQADDMWAFGVTLHLAAFGCYPNGTIEALPTLMKDFEAPNDTPSKLAVLLENLLKVSPTERWTAVDVKKHLASELGLQPEAQPEFQSLLKVMTEGTKDFSISSVGSPLSKLSLA